MGGLPASLNCRPGAGPSTNMTGFGDGHDDAYRRQGHPYSHRIDGSDDCPVDSGAGRLLCHERARARERNPCVSLCRSYSGCRGNLCRMPEAAVAEISPVARSARDRPGDFRLQFLRRDRTAVKGAESATGRVASTLVDCDNVSGRRTRIGPAAPPHNGFCVACSINCVLGALSRANWCIPGERASVAKRTQ